MTVRLVSVIICTHNRAELLTRVVNQIRGQDYPQDAFEIIVVDNRSTDDTQQVVERLATERSVPVRYVPEPRYGVTFARNRGAEEARYPYLAYIDDDCSIRPDWLRQLLSGFELHERVVAVGGRVFPQWDLQKRPPWLGPELEHWLAANSYLGTRSRILDAGENIVEGNMALQRKAWQAAGGFIGMEQFGSQNIAAGEVLYLLEQLRRLGGKIAFIPGAMANHHISGLLTRQWMFKRAYWQGVSSAILEHLLYRQYWVSIVYRTGLNLAKILALMGYAATSSLRKNNAKSMCHLTRAVTRFGLLLGEMRLVGDWCSIRSWLLKQNTAP